MQHTARSVIDIRRWTDSARCFAVLDACDLPAVLAQVSSLPPTTAVSLYREPAASQYAAFAPYLVQVDAATFDWITGTLWSEPWGFFCETGESLETLRTHFRKFLSVTGPAGEDWLFRFYDPRVLPKYLDTCTSDERAAFRGPVSRFAVTDPSTYGVLELAF